MLDLKFVPSENWSSVPFLGPQICLLDEQGRLGFWSGSAYARPSGGNPASTTVAGTVELADQNEADEGVDTTRPASVAVARAAAIPWDPQNGDTSVLVRGKPYMLAGKTAAPHAITAPVSAWKSGAAWVVQRAAGSGLVSFVSDGTSVISPPTAKLTRVGQIATVLCSTTPNEFQIILGGAPSDPYFLGSFTYDQLQAAYPKGNGSSGALYDIATSNPGVWAWCTDLNCEFVPRLDKTNWRSKNGLIVFPSNVGSVASPLPSTMTGVQANTKWGVTSPLVPTNLLNPGDELFPWMITDKTGTVGTSENKIYIGTANDLTGAVILNIASGSPANDFFNTPALIVASATVGVSTRSLAPNSAGTGNPTDITIANASPQYIVYASQMYGAGDTLKLIACGLVVRQQP